MRSLLPHARALAATAGVLLLVLAVLLAMGRPLICACGTVKLWHGVVHSAENSQHIADWYSPSHVIHGLLFYFLAWVLWTRWHVFGEVPARWALPIAAAFEGFWEILENTPFVIDRYREATVSWGYTGDSVVNSMADIGWMIAGFVLASRLPAWVSVALALGLETLTLILIRDNLTLNVLMLLWPLDSVRQWQGMM
ncbi:MAG: DUF2585 domain-containing protein [Novosphingobium sp.]|nr:DUF2585 domain-containing protein [Novosphingobium sp.]